MDKDYVTQIQKRKEQILLLIEQIKQTSEEAQEALKILFNE